MVRMHSLLLLDLWRVVLISLVEQINAAIRKLVGLIIGPSMTCSAEWDFLHHFFL